MFTEIEALTADIGHAFSATQPAKDKDALKHYINESNNSELKLAWKNLTAQLKSCQIKNEVNGGIIEMGQRFSNQLLNILRGSTGGAEVYGPTGQRTHLENGTSIAKA